MMPRESVVITGVGVVSAIGIGQADFFAGLLDRRSGIRSLAERTDGDAAPGSDDTIDGVWIGAPIVDFQPKLYVKPRKALKVMCREIQTAFASAHLALEHAGLSDSIPATEDGGLRPDRLGAVYGSEIFFNPPEELVDSMRACIDEDGRFHGGQFGNAARREVMPLWMLKYLPNMPACQVGISVNSQGPNNTLVLGDVSGPAALLEANSYLDRQIADVMLVGATGTRVNATRMLYHRDSPIPVRGKHAVEDVSRPHDPEAPGVVGGEGAASLVVETASHASARGASVLATVLAVTSRFVPSPAFRSGRRAGAGEAEPPRETSAAIRSAIEGALKEAGLEAGQIGLVVSHAMGDRQVDAGEADALSQCGIVSPVVAVSASIGHLGAASGMIGLATGVLALANQTVPPTLHPSGRAEIQFRKTPEPIESPFVLCLSHTTEGSAMAVILTR